MTLQMVGDQTDISKSQYSNKEIKGNLKRANIATAVGVGGTVPLVAGAIGAGRTTRVLRKPKVFIPIAAGSIGSSLYGQHQFSRAMYKTGKNRQNRKVEKGLISGAVKILKPLTRVSRAGSVSRAGAVAAKNTVKGSSKAKAPGIGPTAPTGGGGNVTTVRGQGGKKVTTNLSTKWGPNDQSVTTRAVTTGRASNPFWRSKQNTHTTTTTRGGGQEPSKYNHHSSQAGHLTGLGRGTVLVGGGAAIGGSAVNQRQKRQIAKSGPDQADVHVHGHERRRKLKRLGVGALTAGGVAGTVGGSAHYSRALELTGKAARGSYKKAGLFGAGALASAGSALVLRGTKE